MSQPHDDDPFADNPELEHAATVAMQAVPVHEPDAGAGKRAAPSGGGGKGKWLAIAAIAVLLVGGGVAAALLLTGGDDDEAKSTASAEEASADEPADEAEPVAEVAADDAPAEPSAADSEEKPVVVAEASAVEAAVPEPVAEAVPAEPPGLLQPPPSEEELAAATALGEALVAAGDDYKALRELHGKPENARSFVVLAATTDDAATAARALTGMHAAYSLGKDKPDPDADFVRVALRWSDVEDGVDWQTLDPALKALGQVGSNGLAQEPIASHLAALIGHAADPAVQVEAIFLANLSDLFEHTVLADAMLAALDSPQAAVVSAALFRISHAHGASEAQQATLAGKARQLLATHADPGVRGRAHGVLAEMRGELAAKPEELLPWLSDWHPFVRSEAATGLASIGFAPAVHALVPMLGDSTGNTYNIDSLREQGSSVHHDGGVWSRVDDSILAAIKALSRSHAAPFDYQIDAKTSGLHIAAARESARAWYEAQRESLPALEVESTPVANAPAEEAVTGLKWQLPATEREFRAGQRVITPNPGQLTGDFASLTATSGWVVVPGVNASLVKTSFAEGWVPNAVILPIRAADGEAPTAEPGDIVLASAFTVYGLHVVVEGGTPDAPMAVAIEGFAAQNEPKQLEPGTFHVVREPLEPGAPVAIAGYNSHDLTRVLAATDAGVLVEKGAAVLAADAVTPVPLRPEVAVGDTVWAANTFGSLAEATVTAVDEATRSIEVEGKGFDAGAKIWPGRYLTEAPPTPQ